MIPPRIRAVGFGDVEAEIPDADSCLADDDFSGAAVPTRAGLDWIGMADGGLELSAAEDAKIIPPVAEPTADADAESVVFGGGGGRD